MYSGLELINTGKFLKHFLGLYYKDLSIDSYYGIRSLLAGIMPRLDQIQQLKRDVIWFRKHYSHFDMNPEILDEINKFIDANYDIDGVLPDSTPF